MTHPQAWREVDPFMSTPDPYTSRVQEAYALARQGDRDGALALLYSVVSAAPDHRDAWWLIAKIALRPDQQEQALRRVLAIDPGFGPAREMAARRSAEAAPTDQPPAAPGGLPPAPDYVSHPDPFAEPADQPPATPRVRPQPAASSGLPPAPDYVSHPAAPAPERRPEQPLEPYYPEREKPKRAADFDRPASRLQPFLIFNGGCVSGCFATFLTLAIFALVAFFILRDSVGTALRSVGALSSGQAVPANLIPAMMLTAALQLLRTTPIALPFDPSRLIPGLDPSMIPELPDSTQIFNQAMGTLWQSLGYPPQTGDLIVGQMQTVGPQIENLSWIVPLLFFGGWAVLAFVFVFTRARSSRFLHWLLATVGLWLVGGAVYGLALVIYQMFGGGGG